MALNFLESGRGDDSFMRLPHGPASEAQSAALARLNEDVAYFIGKDVVIVEDQPWASLTQARK